ncbi:hypothetical protein QQP08_009467 [Theobroma cacao]|nr:hypothetical protein QQP08_009467 [Theobroma cacao]
MKVTTVTTATKANEFKRAPTNLSQDESELVSAYAMVAIDVTEVDEFELRVETKRTTRNMQIETGVRILMISSPNESRRVLGPWFWAISVANLGSSWNLGGFKCDIKSDRGVVDVVALQDFEAKLVTAVAKPVKD